MYCHHCFGFGSTKAPRNSRNIIAVLAPCHRSVKPTSAVDDRKNLLVPGITVPPSLIAHLFTHVSSLCPMYSPYSKVGFHFLNVDWLNFAGVLAMSAMPDAIPDKAKITAAIIRGFIAGQLL